MMGHCFKCREKREFEPTEFKEYPTTKGLKYARRGKCPECGTTISVMVSKDG